MAARPPLFVCALALSLTGCASVGNTVNDSQLTQFQKGVTTENQVLHTLGPPTATTFNSDGSVVLVYTGGHAQVKAPSLVPFVVIFVGGADATSVAFSFGPDHRLIALQPSATPGSSHVRLGVHCIQMTVAFAQRYHLPNENYVRVLTLEAGSVAEAGGIRVGDLLLKYGGRSLNEISDLTAAIAATPKGAIVPITVWRRTHESVVDVQF